MSGTEEQTGGGFARGFIYGMLLAVVAFVAYAILNPLEPGQVDIPATDGETQNLQQTEEPEQDQASIEPVPERRVENEPTKNDPAIEQETQTSQADASTPAGPQFGAPAVDEESGLSSRADTPPSLGGPDTQVAISRPASPDAPAIGTDAPETPVVTDSLSVSDPTGQGGLDVSELIPGDALSDNAVPVQGADGRPYFAIILQDAGDQGFPREGLTALKASISFGVAVDNPEAAEISKLYRDAGFEVVALLPETIAQFEENGPTPQASVNAISEIIAAVPNATAMLDSPSSAFASDPALEQAFLSGVEVTGHGFLSYASDGPSMAARALEAGVPAAEIFREIDQRPEPENVTLALERAVAEAREKGAVVVMGRTRPETITTLFAWLLGPGSSSVKIVPASAAIKRLSE